MADQIEKLVADHTYESGDKLPNEFELAEKLQVSRGTVRESIKILVSRNIVEIRRGRGTFVCKHPGQVDDPLGFSFVEDKTQLSLDMYEVRMMIEPQIARMAAQRATPEELDMLKRAAKKVEEKNRAGEDYSVEDVKFHKALARCSHNQVMYRLMPIIQESITHFINVTNFALRDITILDHEAILEAVCNHDEEAAAEAAKVHLERNWMYVKTIAQASEENN